MTDLTYTEKGAYLQAIGEEMQTYNVCTDAAVDNNARPTMLARIQELLDCSPERAAEIWQYSPELLIKDDEV